MTNKLIRVVAATVTCLSAGASVAIAQEAPKPAGSALPEVEVIQKQAPKPAAKVAPKPKPVAKKPPAPTPVAAPAPEPVADPGPALQNSAYGATNSVGAQQRALRSVTSPVNSTSIVPQNLEQFSAAATIVNAEALAQRQPRNINEVFTRVPGVIVLNDDASGHNGGLGLRGAPPRRSRKLLVTEDGHTVNLALWLDPSVHFFAPADRVESVEVLRGTIITQGPNNNYGVINVRNISPFGPNETVISSAIGFTQSKAGFFDPEGNGDPDDFVRGNSEIDLSAKWHVHTRQSVDNVGIVFSYTGENVQGAWDTERLRFHDFYGALGFKGSSSDLTITATHTRQRDNYDEQNFLGDFEGEVDAAGISAEEAAEQFAEQIRGGAEQAFFNVAHCKTCFAPAAGLNTYVGEIYRGQAVHNAYLDDDTTIMTRFYAGLHRRDRYQLLDYDSNPSGIPGDGPVQEDNSVLFLEDTLFGRLRTFRHVGGEVRGEWADRPFLAGMTQTLQAGIRYEYQDLTNRSILGREDEILVNGAEDGVTIFDRELSANSVSAFLQTNVKVASDFNVVPGVRFEWFDIKRTNHVTAEEESDAEEGEVDDCQDAFGVDECLELGGLNFSPNPAQESFSSFNALPGISFAYTGLKRTTIFGGYNRGLTTAVLRNEQFPSEDEIGDNFSLGLRSTAIKGLDFEVAGFHQRIKNFQYADNFGDATDRSFGRADRVEISGVELAGRLNSHPFTGGPFNVFAEGNYSYTRGIFKADDDADIVGNYIPEVPVHLAALTLGVEKRTGWRWDASMTWTYRGALFTDDENTPYGVYEVECELDGDEYDCEADEPGEDGRVPDVWLLSARFNMDIGNTGASIFVAGDNLLDKLYITDREDGLKPGQGRTVWTGFKYKF
ncbi:MAG: TonB-dependent receptor [Hyphomicrobium sp.]|jgi:Fe(3+) dicitrate transport protein